MLMLLPECLVHVIVCEWLDVKAMARLDSAFCVHAIRLELLRAFTSQTIEHVSLTNRNNAPWMVLRCLAMSNVAVHGTVVDSGNEDELFVTIDDRCEDIVIVPLTCIKLLSVTVTDQIDISIASVMMNSVDMQKLSICCPSLSAVPFSHAYTNLLSLELADLHLSIDGVVSLTTNCPSIVNLCLVSFGGVLDGTVLHFVRNLLSLRTMCLKLCNITNEGMNHIASHCTQRLHHLHIERNTTTITRTILDEIWRKCERLRIFRVICDCFIR